MKLTKKVIAGVCVTMLSSVLLVGTQKTEVQAAIKVKLSENNMELVEGGSRKLEITGTDKKVKWKSKNPKVAKVTKNGKIVAKKKGTTQIIAKVGKKKYTCKVKVIDFATWAGSVFILEGEKQQLTLKGIDEKITWSSKNEKIAKVNKKGKVTAISEGVTYVTAKYGKSKYRFRIEVINKNNAECMLSIDNSTLECDEKK